MTEMTEPHSSLALRSIPARLQGQYWQSLNLPGCSGCPRARPATRKAEKALDPKVDKISRFVFALDDRS